MAKDTASKEMLGLPGSNPNETEKMNAETIDPAASVIPATNEQIAARLRAEIETHAADLPGCRLSVRAGAWSDCPGKTEWQLAAHWGECLCEVADCIGDPAASWTALASKVRAARNTEPDKLRREAAALIAKADALEKEAHP